MAENLLHGVPAKSLSPRAFGWQLVAGWLVINLCVCGLIAAYLVNSQQHFEDAARQSVETLTQVLERDIAASLEKVDTLLQVSADEFQRQLATGKFANAAMEEFLERQRLRQKLITVLVAYDAEGNAIFGTQGKSGPGTSNRDRDYFIHLRDHQDDKPVITKPLFGRVSGQWVIIMARRVQDASGQFAGVVVAGLALENFEKRFANINLGTNGSISIRDADYGVIVRHPPAEKIAGYGATNISDEFREALVANPSAGLYISGATSIDGIRRLHAYRFNPEFRFYINVGKARDDYLAPLVASTEHCPCRGARLHAVQCPRVLPNSSLRQPHG